jgi:sterol 24-C-methyltransferase
VFSLSFHTQESRLSASDSVNKGVDAYSDLHRNESTEKKNEQYKSLVNAYYDLATVFYEWGWGSSFHFSYQYPSECFDESIRRHEYALASHLTVSSTSSHMLDVGCGIGGPMRNICRFLQCKVTGITLNPYQVQRGNELTAKSKDGFCRNNATSMQGDFMNLPYTKDYFDGAYAIEATCHAPDRVQCYKEVYRVLKPGSTFACYEWCLTNQYDPKNPEHVRMKAAIEQGNGLPDIVTTDVCWDALQKAGFQPVQEKDLALVPDVQVWYT